jgi:hypothetical protein
VASLSSVHRRNGAARASIQYVTRSTTVPSAKPNDAAGSLLSLARGERICQAFELFRAIFPAARISFEHAIFLVSALARGNEIRYGRCADCSALVVVDRVMLRETRCLLCARGPRAR